MTVHQVFIHAENIIHEDYGPVRREVWKVIDVPEHSGDGTAARQPTAEYRVREVNQYIVRLYRGGTLVHES